eukprot:scaffold2972_cov92-Skeletonema_dohrnii-CCMP3373.AAC.2
MTAIHDDLSELRSYIFHLLEQAARAHLTLTTISVRIGRGQGVEKDTEKEKHHWKRQGGNPSARHNRQGGEVGS